MLWSLLPEVQAWQRLHDPDHVGKLGTDAFYELMKAAGYHEDVCQKEAAAWAEARQKADLPV